MKLHHYVILPITCGFFAVQAHAEPFVLKSTSFQHDGRLPMQQVFNGFGCEGQNQSPSLEWSGTPKGTKSFVLTAYDPDAPTGSGWWHWVVYNIPADTTGLPVNAGTEGGASLPGDAKQARTDFGSKAYGGACPPKGDRPHRYIFTLHALNIGHLSVPEDASPAMIGFSLRQYQIAKTSLRAKYRR